VSDSSSAALNVQDDENSENTPLDQQNLIESVNDEDNETEADGSPAAVKIRRWMSWRLRKDVKKDRRGRSIGGLSPPNSDLAFIAAITREETVICTGFIIHPRFILTYANCIPTATRYKHVLFITKNIRKRYVSICQISM
jgi:hypothetical protein